METAQNRQSQKHREAKTSFHTAENLGISAFQEGLNRVPAHDKKLMKVLESADPRNTNYLMYKWLDAWDRENMKAEIKICQSLELK